MNIHIKGSEILLTEPECRVERQDIYIMDGVIAGIGMKPVDFVPDKVINGGDKLVMPGLINCHTHAYMSIFRNYADDLLFEDWLFGKIMPVEDRMKPEDAYWCNLLACLEMIRTGTTCFLDMHMFKHQCVKAVEETGLRAVLSRGLVGEDSGDQSGKARIDEAFEEMAATDNPRISFRLAPHAIYTCGEGYLRHLIDLAREKGMGFHTHVSETKGEFDNCMAKHGKTPVEYLNELGLFDIPTVAAHCVYVTEGDIAILADKGVNVATNPVSNMKLANGFAPVTKMMDAGVNVCAGTDGASSNNRINMFAELSALAYIHKGVDKSALSVTAADALQMGTLNGAKALGLSGITGSIEVGKRADLVLVDLKNPQFYPRSNLISALIYSANGSEVDTVIVDGKIIMENKQVLTIDEERLYSEIDRIKNTLL